jgi:hypothetical protein
MKTLKLIAAGTCCVLAVAALCCGAWQVCCFLNLLAVVNLSL